MTEEISRKTLAVLVVLTVLISFLGTFTVINEVNNLKMASTPQGEPVSTGNIKLTIIAPPGESEDEGVSTTGMVSLQKIK